jgi:hypothetical protein
MAKLSETLETAIKSFERAVCRLVMLTAPVWVPLLLYTAIRFVLGGAGELNRVFGLILSSVFVAVLLGAFQGWRHTAGSLQAYSLKEFATILLGFVLVFVSSFSVLSSILYDLDLAEYSSSRGDVGPGPLADFYMWHLIDSIPSVEVWATLDVPNPVTSESRLSELLVLAFRTAIIAPVVALAGKWLAWQLRSVPYEDAGSSAGDAQR